MEVPCFRFDNRLWSSHNSCVPGNIYGHSSLPDAHRTDNLTLTLHYILTSRRLSQHRRSISQLIIRRFWRRTSMADSTPLSVGALLVYLYC